MNESLWKRFFTKESFNIFRTVTPPTCQNFDENFEKCGIEIVQKLADLVGAEK